MVHQKYPGQTGRTVKAHRTKIVLCLEYLHLKIRNGVGSVATGFASHTGWVWAAADAAYLLILDDAGLLAGMMQEELVLNSHHCWIPDRWRNSRSYLNSAAPVSILTRFSSFAALTEEP